MKICGPKCSLCCTIISAWGIVQLGLMAIFFFIESPAFIEDLSIDGEKEKLPAREFLEKMNESYSQIAINCGVAAAMYAATLVFSGWQVYVNKKISSQSIS